MPILVWLSTTLHRLEIPTNITWEQQLLISENTCAHPLNQQNATKISYQLNFLKRLLQVLEKNCTEVHDVIYESYCRLQQSIAKDTTEKYAYKHYILPAFKAKFTLRESKSFVAEGTTGLCSWQASLALADYLLHHQQLVQCKNVVELGAGTGLCGFILTRCCAVQKMLLTDGSAECVALMRENIIRNFANAKESDNIGCFAIGEQKLATCQLSWHEIEHNDWENIDMKPEVVLAADVVYDDSVFADLTHAIDYVFDMMQGKNIMLLAATVRNEHTLNKFLSLLGSLKFHIEELNVRPVEDSYLYWDRTTPVKILQITRASLRD